MPDESKLVRFLVTLSVSLINLFFKIKRAQVNEFVKRVPERGGPMPWVGRAPPQQSHVRLSGPSRSLYEAQAPGTTTTTAAAVKTRYVLKKTQGQSKLPKIDKFMRTYYVYTHLYNWHLLAKNLVLCLLRYETFAPYRYLDCLLLGRFIINGRAIEVVSHCACYAALMRLIWHYTMMRREPEFRMPCIEFLLDRASHEPFWLSASGDSGPERWRRQRGASRLAGFPGHSTLLEYANPFAEQTGQRDQFRLRPNRTREAWNWLARRTRIHHYAFFAFFAFLVVFFYSMGMPMALTQRGFEISYRHCLAWVASERRAGRMPGSRDGTSNENNQHEGANATTTGGRSMLSLQAYQIYAWFEREHKSRTPPKLISDFFMPYRDFVAMNAFQMTRLALELLDSFILYWELAFSYNSASFMAFIMSHDITYYCNSITGRLERLIGALRGRPASASATVRNHRYDALYLTGDRQHSRRYSRDKRLASEWAASEPGGAELRAEAADLQAQVADLFTMIDTYNKYISLQSLCLIVAWLGYSALVSSWIFLPGNENPKVEWYVAHVGATTYVFLMLSSMSDIKASCRRLYRLISVAMALDEDHEMGKLVWASLLKFYSPRPLYCFTLIGSIEITYLLGLKMLAWLVSALIVASSFFQVYNLK